MAQTSAIWAAENSRDALFTALRGVVVGTTVQQRAWTSPIWYEPPLGATGDEHGLASLTDPALPGPPKMCLALLSAYD